MEKPARQRQRRATPQDWVIKNPILDAGEFGYEIGSGHFKVGDGIKKWTELKYFAPIQPGVPGADEALLNHIEAPEPHPAYDEDGVDWVLLYQNAKV